MISSTNKDKDDSLLSLNKDELKIKEPNRRKTNLNLNHPKKSLYAEMLNQKILKKSMTRLRRRSKTLNPNENESVKKRNLKRQTTRKKKSKLLPTKTLPQRKINNMRVAFSNIL